MRRASAIKILEPVWDEIPDLPESVPTPTYKGKTFSAVPKGTSEADSIAPDLRTNPSDIPKGGKNPWVIYGLKDLFYHFGPWVVTLLGAQTVAAYAMSDWAHDHTANPFSLVLASQLLVSLVLDFCVYACLRGSVNSRFIKPGLILFVATVIPGILIGFGDYVFDLSMAR